MQPSSLETDDFGRQTLKPLVLPHAEIQGAMPLCRCVGHCRCGLADALGRAREWRRGAPQAALHVANLHPEVTEEMLYSFFKEVAAVATVRVVRDTRSLESEEHGYVNFYTFQVPLRGPVSLFESSLGCRACSEAAGWCGLTWPATLGA